jgi:hypothetical protein
MYLTAATNGEKKKSKQDWERENEWMHVCIGEYATKRSSS